MKLLTKAHMEKLLKNGENRDQDHPPVVKLFTPDGSATWLLSEIDPYCHDMAFGLCDLGLSLPELGYVSLGAIKSIRGAFGLPVERDKFFTGQYPMSVYADAALHFERITTQPTELKLFIE